MELKKKSQRQLMLQSLRLAGHSSYFRGLLCGSFRHHCKLWKHAVSINCHITFLRDLVIIPLNHALRHISTGLLVFVFILSSLVEWLSHCKLIRSGIFHVSSQTILHALRVGLQTILHALRVGLPLRVGLVYLLCLTNELLEM